MRDAYKFLGLSFLNCFEYRESIRSLRPQWPYSTTVLRCLWHFYDPTVYNANWSVNLPFSLKYENLDLINNTNVCWGVITAFVGPSG